MRCARLTAAASLLLLLASGPVRCATPPQDAEARDVFASTPDDGGWIDDPRPEEVLIERCDIERIAYKDLPVDVFFQQYQGKKPVVIEGLVDAVWPARNKQRWSRQGLISFYGNRTTKVGSGSGIVYSGGNGVRTITLGDYLDSMRVSTEAIGNRTTKACEPSGSGGECAANNAPSADDAQGPETDFNFDVSFLSSSAPEMRGDFTVPEYFLRFCGPEQLESRNSWLMLSIGASRSGLPWHVHGETWIGLAFGKKRWAIYPPGVSAPPAAELAGNFSPMMPSAEWFARVLPNIPAALEERETEAKNAPTEEEKERLLANQEAMPMECVQRAGDVFYLPKNWKHVTMNIGEAVGVGGQTAYGADERRADCFDALRKSPDDFEGHHGAGLGSVHMALSAIQRAEHARSEYGRSSEGDIARRLLEEAVRHFEHAIWRKPHHPETYLLLSETHLHRQDIEAALEVMSRMRGLFTRERMPGVSEQTLLAVRLNMARFYLQLDHPEEAVRELREHVLNLSPEHPDALGDLAMAYAIMGRFDEAEVEMAKALELAPNDKDLLEKKGWMDAERKRASEQAEHEEDAAEEGAADEADEEGEKAVTPAKEEL